MNAQAGIKKIIPDGVLESVKNFCSGADIVVLYGSRVGGWHTQKSDLDVFSLYNKKIEHKIVPIDSAVPISIRELSIEEFLKNETSLFTRIPLLPSITLKGENQWKNIKDKIKRNAYDMSLKNIIEEMKWSGVEYAEIQPEHLASQPFIIECLVDPSFSYKVKKVCKLDFFKDIKNAINIDAPKENGRYLLYADEYDNIDAKSPEEKISEHAITYIGRKRKNLNSVLKGSSKTKSFLILGASAFIESVKALNRIEVSSAYKKKYGRIREGIYDGFGIDDIKNLPDYTFERRIKQRLSF